MSVSGVKLKANCNAVTSGSFINQVISNNSSLVESTTIKTSHNNGTKLNNLSDITKPSKITIVKQESSSVESTNFQSQSQSLSDVQKVLKQEQELQKQLYSGSNVAPGWLRVNHNNKVIYIR
jgi:hypothetical protein